MFPPIAAHLFAPRVLPVSQAVNLLLIGNYAPDRQESMLRFAGCLAEHLPGEGINSQLMQPPPLLGRFARTVHSGIGKWLGYVDKFVLFPRHLQRRIRNGGVDIVHVCDHSNAIYTRYLQRIPHLVTCNDLLAVRSARGEFPQNPTGWTGRRLQKMILSGLNRTHRVTCISEATRDDLLRLSNLEPRRVSVTYMGLHYSYLPMKEETARERLQRLFPGAVPGRYLLHVGGSQWYKNRMGVLKVFAKLRKESKHSGNLILAGKPLPAEARDFIRRENLEGCVFEAVACDNEDLRALYSNAELLFFPSIAEGFGWPILEAQACGCPVITSRRAPMTEVGAEAAVYHEPPGDSAQWEDDAVAKILEVLAWPTEERRLPISAGLENASKFSTAKMIRDYAALYRDFVVSGLPSIQC